MERVHNGMKIAYKQMKRAHKQMKGAHKDDCGTNSVMAFHKLRQIPTTNSHGIFIRQFPKANSL